MSGFTRAVKCFAERVKQDGMAQRHADGVGCKANLDNCSTRIIPGRKYTRVDQGHSGRFMVENSTGIIYGIKGYGKVHKGHSYGTLGTICKFNWGPYYPVKKAVTA